MNTFKFPAFLCLVLALSGCRDYEPENLRISAFMHAYGDNFVAQVGQIAPEQSWDFSTAGGHRGQANRTRAVKLDGDGWYYPDSKTLNWMKDELQEKTNNSDKCQDFFLSWTPGMTFDIVPIYEGLAYMKWDLYMKVTPADGVGDDLYNAKIWSKGENVQLYTTPSTTPGDFQYERDKAAIWFVTDKRQGGSDVYIWPWDYENNGEHFTGNSNTRGTKMNYVGSVGNHNIWQWNCTTTTDIPTKVKFFLPNNEETGEYTFVNHGYLYESNLERPNDNFCIYFRTGRSKPNIYAWTEDGTRLAGDWPGTEMEYVREEDPSHKIYKWTCNTRPTGVKFSEGGNSDNQTGDIILNTNQQYAYYDDYATSDKLSYLSKATNVLSVFTAPDPKSGWHDFEDRSNAQDAEDFRAKKIDIPGLANNNWPLGSIVTFYLKITNLGGADSNSATVGDEMSSLNKQIVYLNVPSDKMPENVTTGEGVVTGILGCEDSKITKTGSDKDYNDVVFLIHGVMPEPVVITDEVSVSTLKKRYMAEDLTNTGDMDFNDIVVDVENVRYTYWNVNESTKERTINTEVNGSRAVTVNGVEKNLTFTNGICDVQTATVQHLCGTIPIRFKVGDTLLPWITDPTNLDQSQKQLKRESVTNLTYGTGSKSTQGIDPKVTLDVTGWDPKTNNVVVYAGWDAENGVATTPPTDSDGGIDSGSDWLATFPVRGTIPCIIATDVTDKWTEECVNINNTGWWKDNFISTKNY